MEPVFIEHHNDICGGVACIAGHRIPIWILESYRRMGWSDKKILESYPHLTEAHLVAAWLYVTCCPEEIEQNIRENEEIL